MNKQNVLKNNPLSGNIGEDKSGGFSKQKKLVVGERVDVSALDRQKRRAKELREIILMNEVEDFNPFELLPKTK